SRNPIYLGDALILTGWCLTLGAASALIAPPLFVAWISRRFIAPEEAALRAAHPEDYAAWSARVRRWI
ncbi:MAG: isoprenylcysteine carboxylmethyltransferase family protein, partial [Pseudomonadota bacterium]